MRNRSIGAMTKAKGYKPSFDRKVCELPWDRSDKYGPISDKVSHCSASSNAFYRTTSLQRRDPKTGGTDLHSRTMARCSRHDGGDNALARLHEESTARGVCVLLDMVARDDDRNHVSLLLGACDRH